MTGPADGVHIGGGVAWRAGMPLKQPSVIHWIALRSGFLCIGWRRPDALAGLTGMACSLGVFLVTVARCSSAEISADKEAGWNVNRRARGRALRP